MSDRTSEPMVYDVDDFCLVHHISRSYFYRMLKEGKGPRLMRVGKRVLVSAESAAEWRRQMEVS